MRGLQKLFCGIVKDTQTAVEALAAGSDAPRHPAGEGVGGGVSPLHPRHSLPIRLWRLEERRKVLSDRNYCTKCTRTNATKTIGSRTLLKQHSYYRITISSEILRYTSRVAQNEFNDSHIV